MANDAKKVLAAGKRKKRRVVKESKPDLLSSGSTLLNLACTNNPFGAFPKGRYVWFVGDSTSGKTFLSLTCFAEAIRDINFRHYRLIYDDVEGGCMMDIPRLFGNKTASKISPPAKDENGEPVFSSTIEEFYYHIDDAIKEARKPNGHPFIYVLDSMDGLSSEAEQDKFEEQKDAYRRGRITAGSYGDGKAKKNSSGVRVVKNGLRDTDSILIIISQTRENLGMGFEKKSVSGGKALRFYAALEIWTSLAGAIKKKVRGKDRKIGIHAKAVLKKNRVTGLLNDGAIIDIYPSYGIDDIGGCVDFLVSEGWWKKNKQSIMATEFKVTCTREKLIAYIEENKLMRQLQRITGRCWKEIQQDTCLNRPKRYDDVDPG